MTRARRTLALALFLPGVVANSSVADGTVFRMVDVERVREAPRTGDQRALIVFDGRRETLVVETEVEHPSTDMAWVLPTPTLVRAAEVHELRPVVFESLHYRTSPTERRIHPPTTALAKDDDGGDGAAPPVRVHEVVTVGAYRVTTLTASESAGLADWLREHGYAVPDNAEPVLGDYIDRGWAFTAIRVTDAEADLPGFTLRPIALSFDCDEAVFPLLISSLNPIDGPTEITLYVAAPFRAECAPYATRKVSLWGLGWGQRPLDGYEARARAAMARDRAFVVEYAGVMRPTDLADLLRDPSDANAEARGMAAPGPEVRLTRLRARLNGADMTRDVMLRPARDQSDHRVRITTWRGFGPAALKGLALALVVGLASMGSFRIARRKGIERPGALVTGIWGGACVVMLAPLALGGPVCGFVWSWPVLALAIGLMVAHRDASPVAGAQLAVASISLAALNVWLVALLATSPGAKASEHLQSALWRAPAAVCAGGCVYVLLRLVGQRRDHALPCGLLASLVLMYVLAT